MDVSLCLSKLPGTSPRHSPCPRSATPLEGDCPAGLRLSVSAIARKVDCDRKTVRKYLELGLEAPVYGPRQPRARVIEAYEWYLHERVQAFPDLSGARLMREIREMF